MNKNNSYTIVSLLLLICLSICGKAQIDETRYNAGKNTFRTLCSSCHSVHKEILGPQLGSITKKRNTEWLINFIRNSQHVIKSGDAYSDSLFKRFNQQQMPAFKKLSDTDIKSILYYIETESLQGREYTHSDTDIPLPANGSSITQGKAEFIEHCSKCHFIHHESYYAPALGSVTKRHSRAWLIDFIHNSQRVIKSGDPYAQNLFNAFDKHVMVSMEFMEKNEINAILDYIEYESTAGTAPATVDGKKMPQQAKDSFSDEVAKHAPLPIETIRGMHLFMGVLICISALALLILAYVTALFIKKYNDSRTNSLAD